MPIRHLVEQGECIASIAYQHGLSPETVWEHPSNMALREKRNHQSVLAPGDVVIVPDRRPYRAELKTGRRFTFVRKGVPAQLIVEYRYDDDTPIAGVPYECDVDGDRRTGTTGSDGRLMEWVSPVAIRAVVRLPSIGQEHGYLLRHLDPVDLPRGVATRLNLLGYGGGDPDTADDAALAGGLAAFQQREELPVTGVADAVTRAALVKRVGC